MPQTVSQLIDLTAIEFPPWARRHSPEDTASLARDMKKNGQLQEIVVCPKSETAATDAAPPGRYVALAGVGRILAARSLGWERIRACVRDGGSEFERLNVTFSENEERDDVSPLYQAGLLERMRRAEDLTQAELAERIGKTQELVSKYLALSDLADGIRENMNRFINLGLRHYIELLRLENADEQVRLANRCAKGAWSVRELKKEVDRSLGAGRRPAKPANRRDAVDPLGSFWSRLLMDPEVAMPGIWDVKYLGGGKWRFEVLAGEAEPRENLASWFAAVTRAFGRPVDASARRTADGSDGRLLERALKGEAGAEAELRGEFDRRFDEAMSRFPGGRKAFMARVAENEAKYGPEEEAGLRRARRELQEIEESYRAADAPPAKRSGRSRPSIRTTRR